TVLAYVLFALALSLSGLLVIGGRLTGMGQGLAARSGYAGSFFTGALATVAANPCTAPFMGAAVGYALAQPPAAALLVFESIALAPLAAASPPATTAAGAPAGAAWEPFSPARLAELRAQGRPVFVNFTAAWCITCLVNERVALRGPAVTEAFARHGVVYLKAD